MKHKFHYPSKHKSNSLSLRRHLPELRRHSLRRLRGIPRGHRDREKSLSLANGPNFFELHIVPNIELVLWVVSLVPLLDSDPALVFGVWGQADDLDCHGLVAGVLDDAALELFHGLDLEGGGREGGG